MTASILLQVYLNCLQNFKLDLQVADFWKLFLETVKNNVIQFSYKPSHNAVCNGLELHSLHRILNHVCSDLERAAAFDIKDPPLFIISSKNCNRPMVVLLQDKA